MLCFILRCFSYNNYASWLYIQLSLGNRVPTFLGNLLVICSFCCCFIVFVCLSLWCWGPDVDLIVSVPEFLYLFWYTVQVLVLFVLFLFGLYITFHNLSVISRRCLDAAGSSMLSFYRVLPHWNIKPQTFDMIFHPVTLYWHWAEQFCLGFGTLCPGSATLCPSFGLLPMSWCILPKFWYTLPMFWYTLPMFWYTLPMFWYILSDFDTHCSSHNSLSRFWKLCLVHSAQVLLHYDYDKVLVYTLPMFWYTLPRLWIFFLTAHK